MCHFLINYFTGKENQMNILSFNINKKMCEQQIV